MKKTLPKKKEEPVDDDDADLKKKTNRVQTDTSMAPAYYSDDDDDDDIDMEDGPSENERFDWVIDFLAIFLYSFLLHFSEISMADNPLLLDLEDPRVVRKSNVEMWYDKVFF